MDQVVFFGSGPVAKASLEFILKHFAVEAIVTKPATKLEMEVLAGDIPIYATQNGVELDELFTAQSFQSKLAVLVDFGVIVSRTIIDSFPLGIVNSHFSLLPKLRGADPITFAILEGYEKTGVSLMLIDEKMDTGKLIAQKTLHIKPGATTPSLTKDLVKISNALLAHYVPRYTAGKIKPRAQPHPGRATYTRKLKKDDGIIDWTKPAVEIEREIRAYAGWPKSRTNIVGKDVIIISARIFADNGKPGTYETKNKDLIIFAGKGALAVNRLKPVGKKEMTGADFIRGYMH